MLPPPWAWPLRDPVAGGGERDGRDGEPGKRAGAVQRLGADRHRLGSHPGNDLFLQLLQLVAQLFGRLAAALRVLAQAMPHDAFEVARQGPVQIGDRGRLIAQDRRQRGELRVAAERTQTCGLDVKRIPATFSICTRDC